MTAAIAFFVRLGIPAPDTAAAGASDMTRILLMKTDKDIFAATNLRKAVIIYGASTSVGAYAVQLAKKAGLFVVGIAGASKDYAKELGADVIVDYREYQGEQLVYNPLTSRRVSSNLLDRSTRLSPPSPTTLRPGR